MGIVAQENYNGLDMTDLSPPLRSVLYIPASKTRALEKAKSLAADAIIFDLEDAVAADVKAEARGLLSEALMAGGYGHRMRIVRINGLDTPWGAEDSEMLCALCADQLHCDAVLLPKVNCPEDVDAFADCLPKGVALWAMMETPRGVLGAAQIAAHTRVEGFVAGTNDLAKELGVDAQSSRQPLMMALQTIVLAGKAHGVAIIDGVYNAFRDEAGLMAELKEGRSFGFEGKSLIHPAQIAPTNAAFAPSAEEVDLARRQINAYDSAIAQGEAVAVVDGKIVENLHVATAQKVLHMAQAIASVEHGGEPCC